MKNRSITLLSRANIRKHLMEGAKQEIMHLAAFTKTHFVLAWMYIDIDQHRIEFQIENIGRMTSMKQDILVGLANSMRDKFVAHHATIDIKVLHVCL